MHDPKNVIGVKAVGRNWQSRETVCEILQANQNTIRYRTTFKDIGEVFESLWSPENPRRTYEDGSSSLQVRTWRNGDEMCAEKAQGYDFRDHCLCTVLDSLYGRHFTGYEHNYLFRDGIAFEMEDGDPEV
jgi:hypothetical protein